MEYVIETKNLTKRYPNKTAANNVNMHVKKRRYIWFYWKEWSW